MNRLAFERKVASVYRDQAAEAVPLWWWTVDHLPPPFATMADRVWASDRPEDWCVWSFALQEAGLRFLLVVALAEACCHLKGKGEQATTRLGKWLQKFGDGGGNWTFLDAIEGVCGDVAALDDLPDEGARQPLSRGGDLVLGELTRLLGDPSWKQVVARITELRNARCHGKWYADEGEAEAERQELRGPLLRLLRGVAFLGRRELGEVTSSEPAWSESGPHRRIRWRRLGLGEEVEELDLAAGCEVPPARVLLVDPESGAGLDLFPLLQRVPVDTGQGTEIALLWWCQEHGRRDPRTWRVQLGSLRRNAALKGQERYWRYDPRRGVEEIAEPGQEGPAPWPREIEFALNAVSRGRRIHSSGRAPTRARSASRSQAPSTGVEIEALVYPFAGIEPVLRCVVAVGPSMELPAELQDAFRSRYPEVYVQGRELPLADVLVRVARAAPVDSRGRFAPRSESGQLEPQWQSWLDLTSWVDPELLGAALEVCGGNADQCPPMPPAPSMPGHADGRSGSGETEPPALDLHRHFGTGGGFAVLAEHALRADSLTADLPLYRLPVGSGFELALRPWLARAAVVRLLLAEFLRHNDRTSSYRAFVAHVLDQGGPAFLGCRGALEEAWWWDRAARLPLLAGSGRGWPGSGGAQDGGWTAILEDLYRLEAWFEGPGGTCGAASLDDRLLRQGLRVLRGRRSGAVDDGGVFSLHFWQLVRCRNLLYQRFVSADRDFAGHPLDLPGRADALDRDVLRAEIDRAVPGACVRIQPTAAEGEPREQRRRITEATRRRLRVCLEAQQGDNSQGEHAPRVGLVVHFRRSGQERDHEGTCPLPPRCSHALSRWVDAVEAVVEILVRVPQVRQLVRGFDLADPSTASGLPVWLVAQQMRAVRSVVPDLPFLVHVGERTRHPLAGLRLVAEAMAGLELGRRDRLCQPLALGLAAVEREGCGRLDMPLLDYLDQLAWEWIGCPSRSPMRESLAGRFSEAATALGRRAARCVRHGDVLRSVMGAAGIELWADAYRARLDPEALRSVGFLADTAGSRPMGGGRWRLPERPATSSPCAAAGPGSARHLMLLEALLFCPSLRWADGYPCDTAKVEIDDFYWERFDEARRAVLAAASESGVALEFSPSANLLRAGGWFTSLADHPILRLTDPVGSAVSNDVAIGTDAPLVLRTSPETEMRLVESVLSTEPRYWPAERVAEWRRRLLEAAARSGLVSDGPIGRRSVDLHAALQRLELGDDGGRYLGL